MKKMLQATSITLAILALSTSLANAAHYKGEYKHNAYAAPAPTTVLNDGLYVGIAGGYDSYGARENTNYSIGGGTALVSNPALRATGFLGGLFGGYGKYFDNLYYLGAEILGNYSSANGNYTILVSDGSALANTNITARGSYGVSILPGIKPTDTSLVYVRLGYNRANFRVQENLTTQTLPPGGGAIITSSAGVSSSNWRGGFNYGLGIETAIYDRFSLRGEFTHTDFGSFKNTTLPNNTGGAPTKFSVADNQFMLGLIYHFECTA